ncbi:MAG: WecB/TagA/CpsF family glycosyltransferase [Dorea sp.]
MNDKINVLDINIDDCTAKEAMQAAVEYINSEPASVIEFVTVDSVMQMSDIPGLKADMDFFDLVLAGEKTILEAAGTSDKKKLQEVDEKVFFKMFLRYLHKHFKRIYLLVESETEAEEFYEHLEKKYKNIQVCGIAKVSAANRADMMLVNAINGCEIDCVISTLASPLQEDFIVKNRKLLNIRVWLGVGKNLLVVKKEKFGQGKIAQFLMKKIFKKEMEKQRKN